MSTIDDKLNEVLGIAEEVIEEKKEVVVTPTAVPANTDPDVDFETGRENLYKLLEKGNEAIDGILNLAKEGEHPRAYEVAGQLIGQVGQTVDKLQDLQKKLKDLKEVPNKTNANIKNALFVGSTAELQKMLNKNTIETNSERKSENEKDFEGKDITPR